MLADATDPTTRLALDTVLAASPARAAPICALYPSCGGCALQHQSAPANLAWKTARVARALNDAGYTDPTMAPSAEARLRSRRRIDLAIERTRTGPILLGLNGRGTHTVVDMTECHVIHPRLFALLDPLRATLRSLQALGRTGSVLANLLDTGPDLLIRTDRAPDSADRTRLAAFAAAEGVCRIAWQDERPGKRLVPELMAQQGPARAIFAGRAIDVPPGAFLQATAESEAAIVAAVLNGLAAPLPPKTNIVELYAGCGTLTLPLAARGRVTAFEGDPAAAAALHKAAGGTRIEVRHRDLARNPVTAGELRQAGAVVLDPPYGGAGRQIEQVAASGSPTIVIVSCNPAALRREAASLHAAGYVLQRATAIDQFIFSPRIESVSVFTRGRAKRPAGAPNRPARPHR